MDGDDNKMKVGLNFERDFPFLDIVRFHYFGNREIKCQNCKDFIQKKCIGGKATRLDITDCLIRKAGSAVQESRHRGMPVYCLFMKR